MAYGAAGKQHGVAGAYTRRNTQGRVEGAFSYPNWRLFCTGSCSAGSTRPDAGLRTPSIAAFGRSRPSAAVDRGSRPSAAAADREIEIDVATVAMRTCGYLIYLVQQVFESTTHGSNQDLAHFLLNMTPFGVFVNVPCF